MKVPQLLSMFAALSVATISPHSPKFIQPERVHVKRSRPAEDEDDYWLRKGLKKFRYDDEFIWARDKPNADRKARNKGLIN